jgi:thiamine-monophosphate kinase
MNLGLGSGPEFDRIRAIAKTLGDRARGLGDDCAFVEAGGEVLALSVDLSVEGVHFRREWLDGREIGWRAAAGALSDLAAVGATPIGLLASLAIPPESSSEEPGCVMDGVGAAVAESGGVVLGGDLTAGPVLTIDVAVLGRVNRPVKRSGARPGDGVWVTGWLGASRAALELLRAGRRPDTPVREAFAHPHPRISAGRWLAAREAHAMIDLSDGLAGDAAHLAAASGVALVIDLERLPLGSGVAAAAADLGVDPHRFAAMGGEDYELLVALPPGISEADTTRFEQDIGIPLTRIGSVTAGEGVSLRQGDERVSLTGFDHFR